MTDLRLLIIVVSAAAALVVGLGARARSPVASGQNRPASHAF